MACWWPQKFVCTVALAYPKIWTKLSKLVPGIFKIILRICPNAASCLHMYNRGALPVVSSTGRSVFGNFSRNYEVRSGSWNSLHLRNILLYFPCEWFSFTREMAIKFFVLTKVLFLAKFVVKIKKQLQKLSLLWWTRTFLPISLFTVENNTEYSILF